MSGRVTLIGAGPGDPELITVKGLRRLQAADIVFYDALVSLELVAFAHHARRFPVGKRAGSHSVRQEEINRLLIRWARRGLNVVRLKCGDPFVLGRGGEEALALAAAGIPTEVIPGVSAAVAAPALAGIPLTHRGLASACVVVSGHAPSAYAPVLVGLVPGTVTVVVLMGLRTRAEIARLLLERGWPRETPVAVLISASTAAAQQWLGTLESLAWPAAIEGDGPATIVIGAVVSLAMHGSRVRADVSLGGTSA